MNVTCCTEIGDPAKKSGNSIPDLVHFILHSHNCCTSTTKPSNSIMFGKPFDDKMMKSPTSSIMTIRSRAMYALEAIDETRNKGERLRVLNRTNSINNLDPLLGSMILISGQPYHFPAIEWCFDKDSGGVDCAAATCGHRDTADHGRLSLL